jgi:CBS domain-containing protein
MSAIAEIIKGKGGMVLSVNEGDSVFEAISLMAEVNVGAVLVTKGDSISGIFTERDYLQKIALNSKSSRETAVSEVMSSPVITASPGETVQECMETMTTCRCRHLPVVEGDQLLGIVSIGDLVKKLLEDKEAEVAQLNQYIAGSY